MSASMSSDPSLQVSLGERSYPIYIETNLLARAGELIRPHLRGRQVFVIADAHVDALHGQALREGLGTLQQHWVEVPAGEVSKSLTSFSKVVEAVLAHGPERGDLVIAFGGGVVGDLAGYVAASVLRGLDFVQIPTSLLAQVDSSVGGKTGINSAHGKNLIGAFHQPKAVLIDLDVLKTLPPREMRAGYGEVVKYGLIDQPIFFDWLERNGADVLAGDQSALRHAILQSCQAKADVVAADERESGRRALLNLGHTFAHAFEAAGKYDGRILHGEAVSVGLVCAHALSRDLGLATGQDLGRLIAHLRALGLPTDLSDFGSIDFGVDDLMATMAKDKKVQAGAIRFVLTRGIGQAFVSEGIDLTQAATLLDRLLSGAEV